MFQGIILVLQKIFNTIWGRKIEAFIVLDLKVQMQNIFMSEYDFVPFQQSDSMKLKNSPLVETNQYAASLSPC